MFLETLDIRKNDILIYSKNLFDFNNNFKIVFKKDPVKRAKSISYFEVCEFVKDPSPKNLIVYRLLTNVPDLDSFSTKYGYFINIEGEMELIYFDPVFAIKDIRHLRFNIEPKKFRFKVQQVGLSYMGKIDFEANFREVFSFDLSAAEAQHQNDKIFAEAIFAFDETFIDEEEKALTSGGIPDDFLKEDKTAGNTEKISEDRSTAPHNFTKVFINETNKPVNVRDEKIKNLKRALGIDTKTDEGSFKFFKHREELRENGRKKTFTEFVNSHKEKATIEKELGNIPDLFELFKTAKRKGDAAIPQRREISLKIDDFRE